MLKKYKFALDNLTYNQVCLIGQSVDYRINFYKDKLVQEPNDKLYLKCLKELQGLKKQTDRLQGKTKISSAEKKVVGIMMNAQLARTK
tara:strand:- start:268 stop:531 length:264 start_codon:yes stop_codon:yes gene_type:complete